MVFSTKIVLNSPSTAHTDKHPPTGFETVCAAIIRCAISLTMLICIHFFFYFSGDYRGHILCYLLVHKLIN